MLLIEMLVSDAIDSGVIECLINFATNGIDGGMKGVMLELALLFF
jgi:hypothetical protein